MNRLVSMKKKKPDNSGSYKLWKFEMIARDQQTIEQTIEQKLPGVNSTYKIKESGHDQAVNVAVWYIFPPNLKKNKNNFQDGFFPKQLKTFWNLDNK